MRLVSTEKFKEKNDKITESSYVVALEIAKQIKKHTIGENLIKPCALKMVEIVLGKEMKVPLSNSTVQRRMSDIATDIKDQVVPEIKSSTFGLFSIQLDESTDVASCSQLMVFASYVHSDSFKEEFLFRSPLELTTKASDILEVSSFFESENLSWDNVSGCCSFGAPALFGTKSGFQVCVKKRAPKVKDIHCMIHRQALA
ncbi:protein FAM200C-like [Palaemon carinicauda]|uniref:protein FAM200C-like n=1 Tax=Palaemon carinicauda TaxID=392227 RepID=UPI0035B5DF97